MSISKNSASSQPAPQQATQQQVEQVIASALPLTGMLPVVEAPTSPDAQGPQQPRESGFAEAMRVAGVIMLGLFFVGIGLGVLVHSYHLPFWVAAGAGVCRFGRVRAD